MKTRFLLLSCLLWSFGILHAAEKPVTSADFKSTYDAASDGDILILASGTYGSAITFPTGKTITIKAADGATPMYTGNIDGGTSATGGGLIFDGIDINRGADYLISGDMGNIKILAFRNSTIRSIGRCLLRTNTEGYTIDKIEFTNCIIKDCGSNGWNFMYPKHGVKEIITTNSTLYNYTNGESFFFANATVSGNVMNFVFENNTVYKWAKSNDRALCKTEGKYSSSSTYTFRNNIITVPGVAGTTPQIVQTSSGTVTGENNLIVNYGGYTGGTQSINDLTLAGLGLSGIGFPDPDNGDFTIINTSPLATASTTGSIIGDPRWLKSIGKVANLTTVISPVEGGTVSPIAAAYESGDWATVTATRAHGYKFKEWQTGGITVSSENPYMFQINDDTEITAIFETIPTYTITINKDGDGANWGKVTLSPEPTNGTYEENTWVTVAIEPNPVTSFLYWDDLSNELTQTVLMDGNKTFTATFDWVPFIAGWGFNPSEPRGDRPGDYYNQSNNQGIMKMFKSGVELANNSSTKTTNWGGSTKTFGGVTYNCARRYTNAAEMSEPRYFQAEFSARDYTTDYETVKYKTIHITSSVAVDNACVHKIQKMQYATNAEGPFTDLVTIDLSNHGGSNSTEWIECNANLSGLTDAEKENIYVRWIADTSSELIGSPGASDTEGFYLANVFIFAELEEEPDPVPPVLNTIVPGDGTSTASANGSIVLTFNERVKAGENEGKVTFNGKELTPVFANKTVSYPYTGLSYGTSYTFTLPAGTITDMPGNAFEGKTITFSTMERPVPALRLFDAVVAGDGSGDYTTLQDAIDAAPINRTIPWLIFMKNGTYYEYVRIPANKPYIHLIGQDKEKVILTFKVNCANVDNASDSGREFSKTVYGLSDCATLVVESSNFYAENISFENAYGVEAQAGPQALAIKTNNDRFAFYNCKFRSFQDTWQTSTKNISDRTYAYQCWIEGAVDYFYGAGDAYVEETTLYNVRSGSVVVAPSHKAGTKYGYVFSNCIYDGNNLANDGKGKLGRPWHDEPVAVYLNTTMKILPAPEGWTNMGPAPKLFAEYNSLDINGNPIDLSQRKTCYQQSEGEGGQLICGLQAVLNTEEAAKYTYENVVSGTDNWNPRSLFESVEKPDNLKITGTIFSWDASAYAICYIIYKDEEVIGFTKETSFIVPDNSSKYWLRAVNEYGSLSEIAVNNIITEKPQVTTNELRISIEGNNIVVNNIQPKEKVALYSIDGRLHYRTIAVSETTYIPVPSMKGIYVVKVGNAAIKIVL